MSEHHGLTLTQVQQSVRDSVYAALQNDAEALGRATEPLYNEDACLWDSFTWTMAMVGMSLHGTPTGGQTFAVPLVVLCLPDGSQREVHADDAPEDCPRGLVVVVKLGAMYLNDHKEAARNLWLDVMAEDEARGVLDSEAPSLIAEIMTRALEAAVTRIRLIQASAMQDLMNPN